MSNKHRLWYRAPAGAWTEALPIGNGRIGAMVFGGTSQERISLNEDSLWSGYPRDTNVPGAAAHYRAAQQMVQAGRLLEAQRFIEDTMLGPYSQSYLPLCDLLFDFGELGDVSDFERSLSLDEAISSVRFTENGVRHVRECFVSQPEQVMYLRLSASEPGRISFAMRYDSKLRHEVCVRDGDTIELRGVAPRFVQPDYIEDDDPILYGETDAERGMRYLALCKAEAKGGSKDAGDDCIRVSGADEVVLKFVTRTSFNGFDVHPYLNGKDEEALCRADLAACSQDYATARTRHIADHAALYHRSSIDLRDDRYDDQPTDVRLRTFAGSQQDDRGLVELMFRYGRYLIIAASRPGSEPTNLQGIWNHHLRAPWSANYTVNINTQMNYWPAEVVGLPELCRPLFDMIADLQVTGARTAKIHYGARGFVSHHNVDLWRLSNPVGNMGRGTAGYAFWPMSFGWLCGHLFEHYQYTRDEAFLRDEALRAIRGAARFFLDIMIRDEEGHLAVSPATSPENAFYFEGEHCNVARAATMSNAIVREVFENYLAALDILGIDEEMAAEVRDALPDIAPFRIGSKGQLLEWDGEYEEVEPEHRHASHMYALHPSRQISPTKTPALAEACRQTLRLRGDEGTGWSLGWKINIWAHLHDGDHALKLIKRQLQLVESVEPLDYLAGGGTYANLFDAHPPFQIDGNYGTCSGIAEMFLQSNGDSLRLLPALPGEWRSGSIEGLRAHGGLKVSLWFEEGALQRALIERIADCRGDMHIHCGGKAWTIDPAPGEQIELP